MNIDTFNQAFREAGEKVLGYKKKKKEEWIQTRTWQKIAERKVIKQSINSTRSERVKDQLKRSYTKTDREVKRLAKVDKKAYVERLADEAEEAARIQDLKTLYRITKTLSGRYINNNVPVKDKEDIIFSEPTRTLCHSRYTCSTRGPGHQHRCTNHGRGESSDQGNEEW